MPSRTSAKARGATVPDDREWAAYTESPELPPVLEHALAAFVESGYHATSVRDLAKRLGQTVPAIYYHYENKQALLVALLSESIEDLLHRCQQANAESDDPLTRLSLVVKCIVLFTTYRRELAFLDAEIRSLEPRNRKAYIAKRDQVEAVVTGAVEDCQAAKVIPRNEDAHAISRAIITMCRGVANWYRPEGPLGPQALADQYVIYALRVAGRTA